jgi:hypothetical protein
VVEKTIVVSDQAGDRLGDGSLEEDGQRVADFILGARPARADGKDLLELVEDEVRDGGRLERGSAAEARADWGDRRVTEC